MIIIDYNDKRPIYEQIIARFETLILNGALEADSQLPSVRTLAIELSINANTIQRAYTELERKGFIYSIKGRGTFVRADENLALSQKKKLLLELQEHINNCKNVGVDYAEIVDCVASAYMEVKE